jgi:hypothetical protein
MWELWEISDRLDFYKFYQGPTFYNEITKLEMDKITPKVTTFYKNIAQSKTLIFL